MKRKNKNKAKAKAQEKARAQSFRKKRPDARRARPPRNDYRKLEYGTYTPCHMLSFRWYGFDLDGTIADNTHHGSGMGMIGAPVKPMVALMKRLHSQGKRIKIVTARINDVGVSPTSQNQLKEHIWEWCDRHLGFRPEITDCKDSSMECLYDDRARQVVRNKGVNMEDIARGLARYIDAFLRKDPKADMKTLVSLRNRCIDLGII